MSSYFSNTEYHLESRREIASGIYNNIQQGSRSALATSVSFNLYNSDGFTEELNLSGNDWQKALGMSNNISNGMFAIDPATGKRNAFDNKLVLGLSQAVTARTFSEFDTSMSNSLKDGRNSLKFLMNEAYRIDPSETKAYASQTVFENIFGSTLRQKGLYLGSNDPNRPTNYYVDQSYQYQSAFDAPRPNGVGSLESRGQETLQRLVDSDLFGGGLVPTISNGSTGDEIKAFNNDRLNNRRRGAGRTITDLDFVRMQSMTNELTKGGVSRTNRINKATAVAIDNSYKQKAETILDDVKYQTRPGILPFVAMFEGAKNSITIDTFQYQNKAISDVVVSKIYRELVVNNNTDFKVNITVGSPLPSDDGTGIAIFGPNIFEIQKLQRLKDQIVDEWVSRGVYDKTKAEEIVNKAFNIQLAGPAHHRKVYITDQFAALGSINLTSPVGDSIFKAGSNFEMMVMFKRNDNLIKDRERYKFVGITEEDVNRYGPSRALKLNYDYDPQRLRDEKGNVYKQTLSALMYKQVEEAQKDQLRSRSRQANVKYATDIMYTLKATIDYLDRKVGNEAGKTLFDQVGNYTGDLRMNMVLDQAYFLHVNHLDDRGYMDKNDPTKPNKNNFERGEMGAFDRDTFESDSNFRTRQDAKYEMYRSMQKKNFAMVALGLTKIVVDSKNFRSQVIEPTWDYINMTLGERFINDYGGSIGSFVSAVTNSNDSLKTKVGKLNAVLGINNDSNLTAYQVLAIASGNISGANVPRQHSKSFTAYRQRGNKITNIASYTGSANLSMSNMGVALNGGYLGINENDPFVTDEMGVVFTNRQVFESEFRSVGSSVNTQADQDYYDNLKAIQHINNEWSMQYEEELYETKELNKAVIMSYNQLNYGNRVSNDIMPSIEGLPYWSQQSNTKDLLKLESSLKEMSKGLGDAMSITRKYDRFGRPLMLEVSINVGGMIGMNLSTSRLTYTLGMLQGTNNQPGPVFFQKEGKLIYNSNFTNNSGQSIDWMFNGGRLNSGQSMEMSSIDNTTSIFATMIGEMAYRQAISNPANRLIGVGEADRVSLIFDFTTSILGIKRDVLTSMKSGLYTDTASYSDYLFEKNEHKRLATELESRFNTMGTSYLDNTRALAGIDVYSRTDLIRQVEMLRNATSGADVNAAISSLSLMLGQQGYEDLSLDVLRSNSGFNIENDLNNQMRELSRTILEPFLGFHQAITYGAGVAASKYLNYGLDSNSRAINTINRAETSGNDLMSVLRWARTFARDIDVYSDFGVDSFGDPRYYLSGVAEGVSTQSKEGYQLESFGVRNKFPTDRNSVDILEAVGIGTLVNKQRLSKKFGDKDAGLIMQELGMKEDDKGILFNLDPNKPAQIAQRIKNALGSRLLYEVSEEAAGQILSGNTLSKFKLDKQKQVKSYVSRLVGLLGNSDKDDKAKKFIEGYLTAEEVNLATMYDTDVRTVLHESAYNSVVEQRKELFSQFDQELDEESKIALNYLFRLKMVSNSLTNPNEIGSVVGGRRDRPQFMILQLNGGYSDHFYLNPEFRTKYYAAAPSPTSTGIKASMLDARTYVGEVRLSGEQLAKDGFVIKDGDMFMYDRQYNKVVQITEDSKGNRVMGTTYVGGTGSSDYLMGQIENFAFAGKPVASVKQRSTSNRPGEDSVQYILKAKVREGGSGPTNEIGLEVTAMNMIMAGSGRRQEGTAAGLLFKGVGAFLDGGQFSKLFNSFSNALGYRSYTRDKDGNRVYDDNSRGVSSFKTMNAQLSDVYGLINPNNLKSGFFVGHGGVLLTTDVEVGGTKQKMAEVLVKQDKRLLAMALVSQFGLDITTSMFEANTNKRLERNARVKNDQAISAYKKQALSGEYGTYLRMLEMQRILKGKRAASNENIFGSIPQFIMNNGELTKAINEALISNTGNLDELLQRYVGEVIGETNGYAINSSDVYTKGVTALLTAIDMFGQLKNQQGDISIVTDWLFKTGIRNDEGKLIGSKTNDPLVEIAAALGGKSNAFNMSEQEKDKLAEMMGIYLQQNYAVALAINVLPSASKDPLGKNLRAKTELQHLLTPLEAQSKQFTRTGNKGNLAYVLGTIMAANDIGAISVGMADSKDYLDSIEAINVLDPATLTGFFGKKFIGVYYSADSNSKELMSEYKRIYSTKIREGFEASKAEQYLMDGSLTLAEAVYADKLLGISTNLDTSYTIRAKKIAISIVEELKQEAIRYNLEESKGMGTDITQPKLKMLMADNNTTTANILMPQVIGDPMMDSATGDYNYVFSTTQNKYMFMPGAELLNQIGSSFGDFVSEIVGRSINMYSYFTPGTAENELLIKIAKAKKAQERSGYANFNVNLSPDEAVMLANFYKLGDDLMTSIIEASSDTLVQKAMAGHGTEFDGYVSTPVPNMSLAVNMNVMPQFVNERYGAPEGIASLRSKLFDVTSEAHMRYVNMSEEFTGYMEKYNKNKQVREFVKSLGTVLDYQKQMLVRGMSNIASLELQHRIGTIAEAHEMVNRAQKGQSINIQDLDKAIDKARTSRDKVRAELDNSGAYDQAYVASYVLANLQFAKIKIDDINNRKKGAKYSMVSDLNTWMADKGANNQASYQEAVYLGNNHEIRDFIHNSPIKNDYSMGLDLVNRYAKDLEGAMRNKHTVYQQATTSIRDLIDDTTSTIDDKYNIVSEYIQQRIDLINSFVDNFAPTAKDNTKPRSRQEEYLTQFNRKLLQNRVLEDGTVQYGLIGHLEDIQKQLIDYKDKGNVTTKFLHYALMEVGMAYNRFSQLDNMQNQSWRSAPFGSTEPHLATLMAIRGVAEFNKMIDNVKVDDNIVKFDVDRSKSLSMFNGLSFLTSNLGDFDGDNYITLMHKITEKMNNINDRQFSITVNKNKLNRPLVSSSALSNEDFEKVQRTIAKEEEKLKEDVLALKGLQIDVNSADNQAKMAKDVAAYMGIDSRFFRGESEGGFRSQGTINISSMAAMLEQGKGLYGGLQGVSGELSSRVDNLLNTTMGSTNAGGLTFDKAALEKMITDMNNSSYADGIYKALFMTDALNNADSKLQGELNETLKESMRVSWEELQDKSNNLHNEGGAVTAQQYFATLVSKLDPIIRSSDVLNKGMGSGMGIGITDSTYDVLTKTLGEAGSDVLGKTYNTLLGTFVADSPIVSLHHILEGNYDQIEQQMNNSRLDDNGAIIPASNTGLGTEFVGRLKAAYDKAQELQGWNKAVQQMLRDSIKLKGDSKSVMEKLKQASEAYVGADEDKRREIINTMASSIGPGGGMKALMDLNMMIHKASGSEGYGLAKDYGLIEGSEERKIAESLTGYTKGGDEDALIRYKVAGSLRSITTMFNFEKNFGEIKVEKVKDGGQRKLVVENKAISNRALESVIASGLYGFLGDTNVRDTMLVLAEHAMGTKEVNGRSATKAVNDLFNVVNNASSASTIEDRDRIVTEQMNKFSAELIRFNSGGVFNTMLHDHLGESISGLNIDALNEVREGGSGLSTASLLVMSHHTSITQTKTLMGDYGSGLDRFIHINQAAQTMQRNISNKFYESGTNLLGRDLFNAAYRLAAQGKLGSEGNNVMTRLYKAVNDPNMSNADAMGQMLSTFSGDQESAKEMGTLFAHLRQVEIQHEVGIDGVPNYKEKVDTLIERQTKKTSQGFKLQAISEVAAAMNASGDLSNIIYKKISSQIMNASTPNLNDDEKKRMVDELMSDQGLLLGGISQEGKDYFKPQQVYRGVDNKPVTEIRSKIAHGGFNIVGPALLSLVGGAIYGTSKDEAGLDAAGIIGSTISLMGFNMPHGKGPAHVAGAIFRSKAYNDPNEDWTQNVARGVSTELSMAIAGQFVTPKLTDIFNRNIVAPLVKGNVPIVESGVSAILGSFVGAIAANMLDAAFQNIGGIAKNKFDRGDNNLNKMIDNLTSSMIDSETARTQAELDPEGSGYVEFEDKLDIPPIVIGVWATDSEIERMWNGNTESYLVAGQEGYV